MKRSSPSNLSTSYLNSKTNPTITYGKWSATSELKWVNKVLFQKFKRRVRRDWSGSGKPGDSWHERSRSMEYDWKPVPIEKGKNKCPSST